MGGLQKSDNEKETNRTDELQNPHIKQHDDHLGELCLIKSHNWGLPISRSE